MSRIIFSDKGVSIAAGLKWSVLKAGKKGLGGRASIRHPAKLVKASRYVQVELDNRQYLGLLTPDVLQATPKRTVHSLALLFLRALMRSAKGADPSTFNALLSMVPEGEPERRAVVIIVAGNIVHDNVETPVRALELYREHHERFGTYFAAYTSLDEIHDGVLIGWSDLLEHASKATATQAVPLSPLVPIAFLAFVAAIGAAAAYHFLVQVPAQEAERARRLAQADKTGQYMKALAAALSSVGGAKESMAAEIERMRSVPYWVRGWSLRSLECQVDHCKESWQREGGLLPDLLAVRAGSSYVAEESLKDEVAVIRTPIDGKTVELSMDAIPTRGLEADQILRPITNTLINAGVHVQAGTPVAWPPVPLTGVRKEAIHNRTKVDFTYSYPFAGQVLDKLPNHVVPESFLLTTGSPFKIVIKGYIYVK